MHALIVRILDDLHGAWRFRWHAVAIAWGACVLGWLYVSVMPNIYGANARVFVDTQSALRPLLKGIAVEPNVESELALVRQAMLSQSNLEKVARQANLDAQAVTAKQKEELLASLQARITVATDVRTSNSAADGLYRISFEDADRSKAQQVVDLLLRTFMEDTLGIKRSGQEDAQSFLKEQIAEYESRLAEAENKLAEFKKHNVGTMPTDKGDYFTRMQEEMTGLDDVRKTLQLAEARRAEMTRQLSGEEPFMFGFDADANQPSSSSSGDVAARIQEMERRREELLLRYTGKHPQVIATEKTIEELKARQADELQRLRSGQRATGDLAQSLKANPVYQSIRVELKRTEVQIAESRRDVAEREARVAELRRLVNTVPEVEAELQRLNRDYEVTQVQYQQLVQRLQTAKISQDADRTGIVKFQVIDPPMVGLQPVAPKRGILLIGVLALGLGAAVGAAYLLNRLQPVFQNVRSLSEIVGLPVLGCVSRTWVQRHVVAARLKLVAFSGVVAMLVVAFGVVFVWQDAAARLAERLMS